MKIRHENHQKVIEDSEEMLAELLVDEGLLSGEPESCSTEVGKRALDTYNRFEYMPLDITEDDMVRLVESDGSQIRNKGAYLSHITNTAGVLKGIVNLLSKKYPELWLPHPDYAHSTGLVHDLNATISNFKKGGHESKEFDGYVLGERHGWHNMSRKISMHSVYLEMIRLFSEGEELENPELEPAYEGMRKVLKGDGPLSYREIEKRFRKFMGGRDNLPLILLTVADHIESGRSEFDPYALEEDFEKRADDIHFRYWGKAIEEGRVPSMVGRALYRGGMDRIKSYKDIVHNLILNNKQTIEILKKESDFFI